MKTKVIIMLSLLFVLCKFSILCASDDKKEYSMDLLIQEFCPESGTGMYLYSASDGLNNKRYLVNINHGVKIINNNPSRFRGRFGNLNLLEDGIVTVTYSSPIYEDNLLGNDANDFKLVIPIKSITIPKRNNYFSETESPLSEPLEKKSKFAFIDTIKIKKCISRLSTESVKSYAFDDYSYKPQYYYIMTRDSNGNKIHSGSPIQIDDNPKENYFIRISPLTIAFLVNEAKEVKLTNIEDKLFGKKLVIYYSEPVKEYVMNGNLLGYYIDVLYIDVY